MTTVLCVDDDIYLTDLLQYALARDGFSVRVAHTGKEALQLLRREAIDLCLLDVNLPDLNGFKVLAALRLFSRLPVIMLTVHTQDEDIVTGFVHGADDYVPKPFSPEVLINRVSAVLRRTASDPVPLPLGAPPYHLDEALFDPDLCEIVNHAARVTLTPTESRILHLLALHAGQVLSPQQILDLLWGHESAAQSAVVKTHVAHLRRKMGRLALPAHLLQTIPGVGYALATATPGQHTAAHGA